MCEYRTADKYKNAEQITQPFQINGKVYTKVKIKCSHCGGSGSYNGFGECFKCHGTGYEIKDVRLYTNEEWDKIQKQKQIDALAVAHNQETVVETVKTRWLKTNNFAINGPTYVVLGNTYPIKDKLKENGFRFSPDLLWHGPKKVEGLLPSDCYYYETGVQDLIWDEDQKTYLLSTKLREIIANSNPKKKSIKTDDDNKDGLFVGAKGERLVKKVQLVDVKYDVKTFSATYIFKIIEENKTIIWDTQAEIEAKVGEIFPMGFTVKCNYRETLLGDVSYVLRCIRKK